MSIIVQSHYPVLTPKPVIENVLHVEVQTRYKLLAHCHPSLYTLRTLVQYKY